MSTRKSKRKLLDPIPPPAHPITHLPSNPADLLEVADGRVRHFWPWPFTDESLEEASSIAGIAPDHSLMHDTVILLRRHLDKRRIVKEIAPPVKAKPKAEIAGILKIATAFSDACRCLSSDAFSLLTKGGSDPTLVYVMGAMPQIEQRAQQLIAADNYARTTGHTDLPLKSKVGRPRGSRSILIGRIEDCYAQHLGPSAKGRRQFVEICLRAIGEATGGGPAEYDTIEQAGRRERARKHSEQPPDL